MINFPGFTIPRGLLATIPVCRYVCKGLWLGSSPDPPNEPSKSSQQDIPRHAACRTDTPSHPTPNGANTRGIRREGQHYMGPRATTRPLYTGHHHRDLPECSEWSLSSDGPGWFANTRRIWPFMTSTSLIMSLMAVLFSNGLVEDS